MSDDRKKIQVTLTVVIVTIAVLALAAGAFAYFSTKPARERKADPEKFVSQALTHTWGLLSLPAYDTDWVYELQNEKHSTEFGFALKDVSLDLNVDRQLLAMAQLARVDINAVRDVPQKKTLMQLALSGGGAKMLEAWIGISPDELAVKLPQGFDYFVSADPRALVSELNASALGGVAAVPDAMTDELVYEAYMRMFADVVKPPAPRLVNDTQKLYTDAEYGFISGKDGVYEYSLKLKCDSVNGWFEALVAGLEDYELFRRSGVDVSQLYYFAITDDIDITLSVKDDVITAARFTVPLQNSVMLEGAVDLRGAANPFDDVLAKLHMTNPNGKPVEPSASFDAAQSFNRYVMIEDMPPQVDIEVTHIGETGAYRGETALSLAADDTRTELSWSYSWTPDADALENFKLSLQAAEHSGQNSAKAGFDITGTVLADSEKKDFLADINSLRVYAADFDGVEQWLEVLFKLRLSAAPEASADYDKTDAVRLSELTPLQLMKIYANFSADPVIGGFMQ